MRAASGRLARCVAVHATCTCGLATSAPAAAAGATLPAAANTAQPAALRPGAVLTANKQFSADEVASFAAITGDSNPIHTCTAEARRRGLPGAVLPGLLMASLFPAIIGSNFPGALYLNQTLRFKRHALVGEALEARLTVERRSGSRVSFQTLCCRQGTGEVLVEGTALALIRPQAPGAADATAAGAASAAADTRAAAEAGSAAAHAPAAAAARGAAGGNAGPAGATAAGVGHAGGSDSHDVS